MLDLIYSSNTQGSTFNVSRNTEICPGGCFQCVVKSHFALLGVPSKPPYVVDNPPVNVDGCTTIHVHIQQGCTVQYQ